MPTLKANHGYRVLTKAVMTTVCTGEVISPHALLRKQKCWLSIRTFHAERRLELFFPSLHLLDLQKSVLQS